jgi:hypothetical protein
MSYHSALGYPGIGVSFRKFKHGEQIMGMHSRNGTWKLSRIKIWVLVLFVLCFESITMCRIVQLGLVLVVTVTLRIRASNFLLGHAKS